jgi:preprotein translocase subunit SecG
MEILLYFVHAVAAVSIILLVLLQHGKGADMGAAFGSGSAGSVFGSAGSANFLSRATSIAAVVFFATSLALTYVGAHRSGPSGVMSGVMKDVPKEVTATKDAAKDATKDASKEVSPGNTIPGTSTPAPSTPASKGNEIPK